MPMRLRGSAWLLGVAVGVASTSEVAAFTSKGKQVISVTASGVDDATVFVPPTIVQQGSGGTTTLGFGDGPPGFRNSGAAIAIDVKTNVAGNRVILYTDNTSATANPKADLDPRTGIDGNGLVGISDHQQFVPLLWVVKDDNVQHAFTTSTIGDDEVFVTDLAHARTFVEAVGQTKNGALDNIATKFCAAGTSHAIEPTNTPNDGLYPQYFGAPGKNLDICSNAASAVTIAGQVINPGQKIPQAEELSKNIAVVAFGFGADGKGLAPNLATSTPTDTIDVTSPIYVAIGADFTRAPAQTYATNTLTIELVNQ